MIWRTRRSSATCPAYTTTIGQCGACGVAPDQAGGRRGSSAALPC